MIREFCAEDKEQIIKILRNGMSIVTNENVNLFTDEAKKIVVYEDNEAGFMGFGSLRIWGEDDKNGEVILYVDPGERRKGIGTLLYDAMMKVADELKLQLIDTAFRVDKEDSTPFFEKYGYKKWYGQHDMLYNGSKQPKSEMKVIPYEDIYFQRYIEALRTSFYEMRRANDFQPYYCCEFSMEKREELLSSKDNIFLLLVSGDLAASAAISESGVLDSVFVVPSYQGKGYGKIITQYAINELINRGVQHITLDVVEWNTRALNLYLGLGFRVIQTTHYFQLRRNIKT